MILTAALNAYDLRQGGKCTRVHLFLYWSVCQQDYTKTAEWVSKKLGWRLGPSPGETTFGADLDKGTDPGIFSLSLTVFVTEMFFLLVTRLKDSK